MFCEAEVKGLLTLTIVLCYILSKIVVKGKIFVYIRANRLMNVSLCLDSNSSEFVNLNVSLRGRERT